MSLWLKMAGMDFLWALTIVGATRAYVIGSYPQTAAFEVACTAIIVWDKRISFDEERARSWNYGFPARAVGSVAGALLGMYISKVLLGQ